MKYQGIYQKNMIREYAEKYPPQTATLYWATQKCQSLQTQRFLQDHHNFKLLSSKHLLPSEHGTDGFFMALLEKSA